MNPTARVIVLLSAFLFACQAPAQPSGGGRRSADPASAKLQERRQGELALTTSRVVIFKDGYALIVKKARGTADNFGRVHTTDVPDAAVLGSFWATSETNAIRAMRAEHITEDTDRQRETTAITIQDLLRANVGKAVTLDVVMGGPAPTTYTGVLEQILEQPPPPIRAVEDEEREAATSGSAVPPRREGEVVTARTPLGGGYLLLRTDNAQASRLVLPVDAVRAVSGNDIGVTLRRDEHVRATRKQLSFDLEGDGGGKEVSLTLFYFTPGLRWIPTYRVAGGGKGGAIDASADVALQAEIVNELEDLSDVAVSLVVGVPNFRFKSIPSPLTLEGVMRNALAQAAPTLMGRGQQQFSNALFSQRSGEWRQQQEEPSGLPGAPAGFAPEIASAGEQDLYVYSTPPLSLRKGARAAMPLWTATAPVRHLHTMDLAIVRNPRDDGRGRAGDYYCYDAKGASLSTMAPSAFPASPLRLANQPVWHQLELTNNSDTPWTTGPAMILHGFVPLAQELLTYTPAKGAALVPVTIAMDLRGTYNEQEIDRKPNALEWGNHSYSLIRKRATISISSYRQVASEVKISIGLGGRVAEATDGGSVKINDLRSDDWGNSGNYEPNNHSDVSWSFTLEPGQTRTVTMDFQFYVW